MTDDEIIAAYDSQIGAGAGYHRAGLRAVERAARAAERAEIARKLRDWKADTELLRDDWNRARALALGDAATYVEERARADSEGDGEGGR